MFKLILLFILFTVFAINYFFAYLYTIPSLNFIKKFNLYEYLIDKTQDRIDMFTGIEYKIASSDENYILDYTGGILETDLKYLSSKSDHFSVFIPIYIGHTGGSLLNSGDVYFNSLNLKEDFSGYYQYLSGGNNYIDIGEEIINGIVHNQTLFLGKFYFYCSMSQTGWIDAYYYDRYSQKNKTETDITEQKVSGAYVCNTGVSIGEYQRLVCTAWSWMGWCIKHENRTYYSCTCDDKGEYQICSKNTDLATNPDGKDCTDTSGTCIDYYTGTINLNNTNCSLSGALGTGVNSKYFLLR